MSNDWRPPTIEAARLLRLRGAPLSVPQRVSLQITNACNSKCTHCAIWQIYRREPERVGRELTSPEWCSLIDDLHAIGTTSFDVTGGEPFLKDGVELILGRVLDLSGFVCVTTNALQPERYVNTLAECVQQISRSSTCVVSVSIDGSREIHDQVRGVRGGFDRCMTMLEMLPSISTDVCRVVPQVSFTITDSNLEDLLPLADQVLSTGLITSPDNFTFRTVQSGSYYGAENAAPDARRTKEVVTEFARRYTVPRNRVFLEGIARQLVEPEALQLPCQAMFVSCWIDPYGFVAPCVTMTEIHIGQARTAGDLLAVWTSSRAASMRAEVAAGRCAVCWTDCQAHENIWYSEGDILGSPIQHPSRRK